MLAVAYKLTDLDADILAPSQDKKVIARTPIISPPSFLRNFTLSQLKTQLI